MKAAALPRYCLLCCARWWENFEFVGNILKCDHSLVGVLIHTEEGGVLIGGGGRYSPIHMGGVVPFLGVLPYITYLNNRALLSKALSCDRLPKEIDIHNKYLSP